MEGLGERRFRTALEIEAPSHAGSLAVASANWTLSCQDTSDRAMAILSLVGVEWSVGAGVTAAGSPERFVFLGNESRPAVMWTEVRRLC